MKVLETDEAEMTLFHDLEYCKECDVTICHSCSPEECTLNEDLEEPDGA